MFLVNNLRVGYYTKAKHDSILSVQDRPIDSYKFNNGYSFIELSAQLLRASTPGLCRAERQKSEPRSTQYFVSVCTLYCMSLLSYPV